MEDSSKFVPLGIPRGKLPFDKPEKPVRPERRRGKTPEKSKQVTCDILNAQKEKKLAKAEAKRLRKLNSIMNPRMISDPEKYVKNKEYNRICTLDTERHKIQTQTVRQAERSAAKYDSTGKIFNIDEVVVSKDEYEEWKAELKVIAGQKAQREAENAAKETGVAASANPERASQKQGFVQEALRKPKIIKKQQEKRAALGAIQGPPPRPVLPEGISIPEGEENFIAMLDITDEEIHNRMTNGKRIRSIALNDLRRRQKEEKRFNQAVKQLKRQTENRGEKLDPVRGRACVLKLHEEEGPVDDNQESCPDSDGTEKLVEPVEAEEESEKSKKAKDCEPTSNGDYVQVSPLESQSEKKRSKRPAEDDPVEEPKAKKRKKSKTYKSESVEAVEAPTPTETEPATTEKKKKKKKKDKKGSSEMTFESVPEQIVEEAVKEASEPEAGSKDGLKAAKRARRAANEKKVKKFLEKENERVEMDRLAQEQEKAQTAETAAVIAAKRSSKKQKHEKGEAKAPAKEKSHKRKKAKSTESTNGAAEQWNPGALIGDAARKEKFLRLLGAGKTSAVATDSSKYKSTAKVEDITKVQSELERQYEIGMKMKHDGGSKRRGLGA